MKRDINVDIIRIIAFICVVSIHFFWYSGFYEVLVIGWKLYVMVFFNTFFRVCVPLFMLLTGYLMSEKRVELSKYWTYLKKLEKILITYVVVTLVIIGFRIQFMDEVFSFRSILIEFPAFSHYGWYVNQYLGLYLLIPFLNILWNAISSKKDHRLLLIVCGALTMLPSVLNVYDLESLNDIFHMGYYNEYRRLIPDWWISLYPITYYYIGAYLKKYIDIGKLSTIKLFLGLIIAVLFGTVYNIWRSYGALFILGEWTAWGSLFNTIDAVLLFLLIKSIKFKSVPQPLAKCINVMAEVTFGAYILSWIPDHIYYEMYKERYSDVFKMFLHFPMIVGKNIIISLSLSFGIWIIIKLFNSLIHCINKTKGIKHS